MNLQLSIGPLVSLIAGILILVVPRLLNYIVAIYLILIGLIGIFGWGNSRIHTTSLDSHPVAVATTASAVMPAQSVAGPLVVDARS